MTVQEYAKKHNISERTVYRMLDRGEIDGQKVKGKWTIFEDTDEVDNLSDTNEQLVQQLSEKQEEIEYLRNELSKANETIADMQQRHDTIVMSLSNQLAEERKKLEDMRNRKLWTRVKTALGFASS